VLPAAAAGQGRQARRTLQHPGQQQLLLPLLQEVPLLLLLLAGVQTPLPNPSAAAGVVAPGKRLWPYPLLLLLPAAAAGAPPLLLPSAVPQHLPAVSSLPHVFAWQLRQLLHPALSFWHVLLSLQHWLTGHQAAGA
jgi:hypothetical protein